MANSDSCAWSTYWSQQDIGYCVPFAPVDVARALQDQWKLAAQGFTPNSKVLDLGCGAGSVAHLMAQINPRLQLIGVDFSNVPAARFSQVVIHSGVRMEQLPFNNHSFDGAVSQFGIEYSDIPETAAELARVLKSKAPVSFVVHHAGSPITAHNRRRRNALEVVAGAEVGAAFVSGDRAALAKVLTPLLQSFPDQDVVAEFAVGLGQAIAQGPRERQELWTSLCGKVTDERAILSALETAAVTDLPAWLALFHDRFEFEPANVIADSRGHPFAWSINGKRV